MHIGVFLSFVFVSICTHESFNKCMYVCTICPRSLVHFYIASHCMKIDKTSWRSLSSDITSSKGFYINWWEEEKTKDNWKRTHQG